MKKDKTDRFIIILMVWGTKTSSHDAFLGAMHFILWAPENNPLHTKCKATCPYFLSIVEAITKL